MADENRVADGLLAPDSNTRRFHRGNAPQWDPFGGGDDATEEEQAALAAHRAAIHVPESRPRWGVDEDGVPIEAPAPGLVFNEETGALEIPEPPAEEAAAAPKATTTSTRTTSTSTSGSTSGSSTSS